MPKLKTHSGAAKRFKKTASGKIKRGQAFQRSRRGNRFLTFVFCLPSLPGLKAPDRALRAIVASPRAVDAATMAARVAPAVLRAVIATAGDCAVA